MNNTTIYFIPEEKCSTCGYGMDATGVAEVLDSKPGSGDISLCLNCGHIALFNSDLTRREATEKEMEEIKNGSNWPLLEKAWSEIKKRGPIPTP